MSRAITTTTAMITELCGDRVNVSYKQHYRYDTFGNHKNNWDTHPKLAAGRLGDIASGHGCFPPTPITSGSSDVSINGLPAARKGDSVLLHACPCPYMPHGIHGRSISAGSPTVSINGKPAARVGDAINCGGSVAAGSPNVYIGSKSYRSPVHECVKNAVTNNEPFLSITPLVDALPTTWYLNNYTYPVTTATKAVETSMTESSDEEGFGVMDGIHAALDAGGLAPGVGIIPDALNALIYAIEGDKVNAAISAAAMIPVVGQSATAAKYAAKAAESVTGIVKVADRKVASGVVDSASEIGAKVESKLDDITELAPGEKGSWNKELNKKLKANHKYKVGDYLYETDELGRVKRVSGELDLNTRSRNTYQQGKSAKEAGIKDGLSDDDGGHLIASIFDGAGEQINYAPMNSNLNRGAWKKMENQWAEALKGNPPKEVKVDIQPIYEGVSKRPSKFIVKYTIGGEPFKSRFKNIAGG